MADVHGNLHALEAVLADAASRRIDRWWALGDLVAFGPDPVGVLEHLVQLPDVEFIGGNTDRYVVRNERPYPIFADVEANTSLIP